MQQVTTHYEKIEENDIQKESAAIKSESLSDRDAGFCSGEETDLDTEYHSPTDTNHSHDSVMDSKDFVIDTFPQTNNKRKAMDDEDAPESKTIKLEICSDRAASPCSVRSSGSVTPYIKEEKPCSPFRPWSIERPCSRDYSPVPSGYVPPYLNCPTYMQEEPLALVVEKKKLREELSVSCRLSDCSSPPSVTADEEERDFSVRLRPQEVVRLPPDVDEKCNVSPNTQSSLLSHEVSSKKRCGNSFSVIVSPEGNSSQCRASSSSSSHGNTLASGGSSSQQQQQQRNYKNMTRERRIEANARERTRVHTISAAFETLRNCIPAYANNQKLSKLSVLRIACSYIMTLSRIAGYDYSIDESAPSLAECVDNVCSTIQMEGKTRKKKDD